MLQVPALEYTKIASGKYSGFNIIAEEQKPMPLAEQLQTYTYGYDQGFAAASNANSMVPPLLPLPLGMGLPQESSSPESSERARISNLSCTWEDLCFITSYRP